MRCGYNLRTVPVDGGCPECGFPVRNSMVRMPFSVHDQKSVGRWRLVLTLHMGDCLLLLLLGLLAVAFALSAFGLERPLFRGAFLGLASLLIIAEHMLWLVTVVSMRRSVSQPQSLLQGKPVLIAGLGMICVSATFAIHYLPRQPTVSSELTILLGSAILVWIAAASRVYVVRRVMQQHGLVGRGLGRHDLFRRAKWMGRTMAAFLVVFAVSLILGVCTMGFSLWLALASLLGFLFFQAIVVVGVLVPTLSQMGPADRTDPSVIPPHKP